MSKKHQLMLIELFIYIKNNIHMWISKDCLYFFDYYLLDTAMWTSDRSLN